MERRRAVRPRPPGTCGFRVSCRAPQEAMRRRLGRRRLPRPRWRTPYPSSTRSESSYPCPPGRVGTRRIRTFRRAAERCLRSDPRPASKGLRRPTKMGPIVPTSLHDTRGIAARRANGDTLGRDPLSSGAVRLRRLQPERTNELRTCRRGARKSRTVARVTHRGGRDLHPTTTYERHRAGRRPPGS